MTSPVYKKKCINFSKEAYASYGTKAIYVQLVQGMKANNPK